MAKKPIMIFKVINFKVAAALLGEGAGTLEDETIAGETNAEDDGAGEEAT
jgi:hypothetical protein